MESVELIERIEILFEKLGYWLIFVTSFIESSPFGWATPGGLVLATGGFFSKDGGLSIGLVILSGFLGTWSMLIVSYYLGQKSGMAIARKLKQETKARKALSLLEKHGGIILTTSLTSNVTRFWLSYVAGSKEFDKTRFVLLSSMASITWVVLWATTGFIAGGERSDLERLLPKLGVFSWVLFAIAIGTLYWSSKREYEELSKDQGTIKGK